MNSYWLPQELCGTISNKVPLKPHEYTGDPPRHAGGWERGYSFLRFWSNCYFLLGDYAKLEGIQQLCHHYYLQNGSIGATDTCVRIRKFLSL